MLIMFAMVGFTQGSFWNTWGPISASSELVFGWSDATIALMTNWGPITYIISNNTFFAISSFLSEKYQNNKSYILIYFSFFSLSLSLFRISFQVHRNEFVYNEDMGCNEQIFLR